MRHPIPFVPPEQVAGRIQRRILRPPGVNPHIGVLGPTRSGKDFTWRHLILGQAKPIARAIAVDVKPGHDLCDAPECRGLGDQSLCGWGIDVGPGAELGELPAHLGTRRYRVLASAVSELGRPVVETVLGYADAVRELVLIFSDVGRITEAQGKRGGFGLGGAVTRLMSERASSGLSVVACSTSAAYAESGVKDQTAAVLVGQVVNVKMRATFAELAGLPKWARPALDSLKPRQFLYADYCDGEPTLAITQARPVPGA